MQNTLEPLSQLAIRRIAEDTLHNHYHVPHVILTADDYGTLLGQVRNPFQIQGAGYRVEVGMTDWHHQTLRFDDGLVCSYTGYTRNQMLAAMLNAELADEYALIATEQEFEYWTDEDEAAYNSDEYVTGDEFHAISEDSYTPNWVYPSPMEHNDRVYAQHQANRYMC